MYSRTGSRGEPCAYITSPVDLHRLETRQEVPQARFSLALLAAGELVARPLDRGARVGIELTCGVEQRVLVVCPAGTGRARGPSPPYARGSTSRITLAQAFARLRPVADDVAQDRRSARLPRPRRVGEGGLERGPVAVQVGDQGGQAGIPRDRGPCPARPGGPQALARGPRVPSGGAGLSRARVGARKLPRPGDSRESRQDALDGRFPAPRARRRGRARAAAARCARARSRTARGQHQALDRSAACRARARARPGAGPAARSPSARRASPAA
jgi:hypothetical protein